MSNINKFFCFFTAKYLKLHPEKIIFEMKKSIKILLAVFLAAGIVAGVVGFNIYNKVYSANVFIKDTEYLYIRNGADFQTVLDSLYKNFDVKDKDGLEFVANRKNYPSKIKGGRYKLSDKMSSNALINLLRSGSQSEVSLAFNNLRTVKQLCSRVAQKIDVDSNMLYDLLKNEEYLKKFGFNPETCNAMFIPDTYNFYWNTSEESFVEKMYSYYQKFWTDERKKKAAAINLTPLEVSILASIVQMEQARFRDEQPIIAGLYINRMKIGMPLQSCPTLIYAIGDFSIRRVTGKMLEFDSPYNTYKYPGLPPSPICFPEKSALEAVLDYDRNDYIYMCAKSDFSGRHFFSKSYEDQKRHARDFQRELDKQGIK